MFLTFFLVTACTGEKGGTPSLPVDDTGTVATDDSASVPDDSATVPDDSGNPPDDSGNPPDDSATVPDDSGEPADDTGGPGPDPDPGEPVAQPKWHQMWGATDIAFRMDGRGSYDPAGYALSYAWTATAGTFDDATSATPLYTGASGTVTLTVSTSAQTSDPVSMTVNTASGAARIPDEYDTPAEAIAAGYTILLLEPGTYGPIDGAAAIIGDPDGGVVIDAEGAANAISGASYLRHLTITGAATHGVYADEDVRMHDVVIQDNGNTAENGGGIWSDATVILYDVVVQRNTGMLGGGIYLERSASLYGQQVVIADNVADYGGGIYTNTTAGNVSLFNALVVGNVGNINGGGGVFLDSRAFLTRTTVADNENGGIRLRYGYFEVDETLFAYNSVYGIDEADAPTVHINDCLFGTSDVVSGGDAPDPALGNLEGDAVFESFTAGDDWTDQDFRLDPSSPGADALSGEDRDGTAQDVGGYGGFLGRYLSGEQGVW